MGEIVGKKEENVQRKEKWRKNNNKNKKSVGCDVLITAITAYDVVFLFCSFFLFLLFWSKFTFKNRFKRQSKMYFPMDVLYILFKNETRFLWILLSVVAPLPQTLFHRNSSKAAFSTPTIWHFFLLFIFRPDFEGFMQIRLLAKLGGFSSVEEKILSRFSNPLRAKITKNIDWSTGPLARSLVRSFARTTH